ncbi:lin-54 family [Artemisia annua]|uniref:Lin-54 family n=1 Tax=Artemisia annua TaxID=35608 RepID=A0A2U1MTG2_ARTAN|nr:lin-54 family [Artemisia annua]
MASQPFSPGNIPSFLPSSRSSRNIRSLSSELPHHLPVWKNKKMKKAQLFYFFSISTNQFDTFRVERGCNGEGRMQGGIATVPGFGWWPIKAYRPCPSFVATGGRYRRQGQSMDEVAGFGSVPRIGPVTATTTAAAAPAAGETQSR